MLLRKPTRIELKPEDKEVLMLPATSDRADCSAIYPAGDLALQYETVKKAQAEAQARQQAEGGQQAKSEQQPQASCISLLDTHL